MDYFRSKRFLDALPDWEAGRPAPGPPEHYLPRMRAVLARLGQPQEHCPSVIVGGTNGKGTVSSLLAALLQAAGHRVGLYTSPHLHTQRERIRIDGQVVNKDTWAAGVTVLDDATRRFEAEGWGPFTRFEALTGLAAHLFAAAGVDIAVYEVGLGGRYDATNAWDSDLAVLTAIGLDHTEVLGPTLTAIARDKVCIARPGRRLYTLIDQPPEAMAAIEANAQERGIELWRVGLGGASGPGGRAEALLVDPGQPPERPLTWAGNARLAVAAAGSLAGAALTPAAAAQAVSQHQWPGRLEVARREPLVLIDGAHNAPAAAVLADDLRRRGQDWTLVFGGSRGHDAAAVLHALAPCCQRVVLTSSEHARAVPPAELADQVPAGLAAAVVPSCRDAFEQAVAAAGPQGCVCITGSLYLVARAREHFDLPGERDGVTEDVARESLACLEEACRRLGASFAPVTADGNVVRVERGHRRAHFLRNKHPFNDYVAARLAEDKGYQHELFTQARVPTPRTLAVFNPLADARFDRYRTHASIAAAVAAVQSQLDFPVVVKKHQSSLAQGVFLERDAEGLSRRLQTVFESAGFLDNLVLVQQWVAGPEYRVVATRAELLLAYAKVSEAGAGAGDLNPLHQADGRAERVVDAALLERLRQLTAQVGPILDLALYAIDLIDTAAGFVVLELNPNPFCFFYNRSHGRDDFVAIYTRLLGEFLGASRGA